MKRATVAMLTMASGVFVSAADAHVSVASGPAFANTTQEVTFGVGHGCAGADTYSVKVDIPAGVTSVRTMGSDLGAATVTKDAAGLVTSVTWQKTDDKVLPEDTAYYKLVLRIKVPNTPFATLHFPAHQTCKGGDGGVTTVEWTSTVAASGDAGADEPAPALVILPARKAGWNKITVPVALTDLAAVFGDAHIVWKGNAAFSANANTAELAAKTPGVTALTSLAANDEVWVRY